MYAELNWRLRGYAPDDTPNRAYRESGLQVMERHGMAAHDPHQVYRFLEGAELMVMAAGAVRPVTLSEAERLRILGSLASVRERVSVYAIMAHEHLACFVPRRGLIEGRTRLSLAVGLFAPSDWEEYRLIPPLAAAVQHVQETTGVERILGSRRAIDHDVAYCVLQGARWMTRRVLDDVSGAQYAERFARLCLRWVAEHCLEFADPAAVEQAQASL